REFFHLVRGAIHVLAPAGMVVRAGGVARQRFDPAVGPVGQRGLVRRVARLHQVLGQLAVLLEVGTDGKRKRALRIGKHTELLSVLAWESARIRLKEVRDRLWCCRVGTALSADWMRPVALSQVSLGICRCQRPGTRTGYGGTG